MHLINIKKRRLKWITNDPPNALSATCPSSTRQHTRRFIIVCVMKYWNVIRHDWNVLTSWSDKGKKKERRRRRNDGWWMNVSNYTHTNFIHGTWKRISVYRETNPTFNMWLPSITASGFGSKTDEKPHTPLELVFLSFCWRRPFRNNHHRQK